MPARCPTTPGPVEVVYRHFMVPRVAMNAAGAGRNRPRRHAYKARTKAVASVVRTPAHASQAAIRGNVTGEGNGFGFIEHGSFDWWGRQSRRGRSR